jgi:hypothetical protein
VFFRSFVPTGLVLNLTPDPGTEVPGYFHLIPTGRKMAKLLAAPSIVRRGAYHKVLGGDMSHNHRLRQF